MLVEMIILGFESLKSILDMNILYLVLLIGLLGTAVFFDIKELRIPNYLNLSLLIINTAIFILVPLVKQGTAAFSEIGPHLFSGLFGFILFLLIAMKTKFKMAGDIKFIGAFGICLGWSIFLFIALACLLNIITNLTIIKLKKRSFDNVIPFAPFFAASFIILLAMSSTI